MFLKLHWLAEIFSIKEWWIKILDLAEMDKLTTLVKGNDEMICVYEKYNKVNLNIGREKQKNSW